MEDINRYAVSGYMPDMTFLMKVNLNVGSDRIKGRRRDRIEMEDKDFYCRVYEGYEMIQRDFPDRIIGIDASGEIDVIGSTITDHVQRLMEGKR